MLGQARREAHVSFHTSMGHLFLSSPEISQLLSSFKSKPSLSRKWLYGDGYLPTLLTESICIPAEAPLRQDGTPQRKMGWMCYVPIATLATNHWVSLFLYIYLYVLVPCIYLKFIA